VEERLQKILSRAGIASRRAAERFIKEGRVTVDGRTVSELGSKADPDQNDIRVDGQRVTIASLRAYLMLNKPRGCVTTRSDPEGRPTVMDLVPRIPGLYPVGRLDVNTEGLLLMTNDGALAMRITHPKYEIPRIYLVKVRGLPTHDALARLKAGITLDGERLRVDEARILKSEGNAWIELTLHEGKRHEVRRLMEAIGHPVAKLKRIGLGELRLKGLAAGEYRALLPYEVRALARYNPVRQRVLQQKKAAGERTSQRPGRTNRRPDPARKGRR
jgi:pseudouridine synthase